MFELYQLRYFTAVVETGSFTRASQHVRVSQPTLSAGVRKLEEIVGASLLERTSRRVALTREGSRFLLHARSILAEAEAAMSELSASKPREVLTIGALITLPGSTLARIVSEFTRREPRVQLALFDGTERELHARLAAGRLHAALTIERSELRTRADVLFEEGYTVALPSSHAFAHRGSVEVSELGDEPTIVRTRCEALASVSRFFTMHGLRPAIAYRTEQDERALSLVGAGLGITVMPQSYRSELVVQVPLAGFDLTRRICLAYPSARERKQNTALSRFAEAARHGLGLRHAG